MGWNYFPFTNFNGTTVEVWEWIINFFPLFTRHINTCPCWDLSWTMLLKGTPGRMSSICAMSALSNDAKYISTFLLINQPFAELLTQHFTHSRCGGNLSYFRFRLPPRFRSLFYPVVQYDMPIWQVLPEPGSDCTCCIWMKPRPVSITPINRMHVDSSTYWLSQKGHTGINASVTRSIILMGKIIYASASWSFQAWKPSVRYVHYITSYVRHRVPKYHR